MEEATTVSSEGEEMTGAYMRVKRDGKWKSIEVEFLTHDERRKSLGGRSEEELLNWIDLLCVKLEEIDYFIAKELQP